MALHAGSALVLLTDAAALLLLGGGADGEIPAHDVERLRHLLAGRAYALVPARRPGGSDGGRRGRRRWRTRTELAERKVSP